MIRELAFCYKYATPNGVKVAQPGSATGYRHDAPNGAFPGRRKCLARAGAARQTVNTGSAGIPYRHRVLTAHSPGGMVRAGLADWPRRSTLKFETWCFPAAWSLKLEAFIPFLLFSRLHSRHRRGS